MESQLSGDAGERPWRQREAEREGPELERPPFPYKTQPPLPVFGVYQDVEEGLRHVEGGSPISLLDRISDRQSRFHAEMGPTEVEVEDREGSWGYPWKARGGFGDHEDPAVEVWGRKVGHLFDGLFVEEGRDLLFQGSCYHG